MMNEKWIGLGLFVYALILAAPSFGEDAAPPKASGAPLVWMDGEDSRVLFTSNDIIAFDWDKQIFLLTVDARLNLMDWMPPLHHLIRGMVVKDRDGVIYKANWISGLSSNGCRGPAYDLESVGHFVSIENGYPGAREGDEDLRFNPRLRDALDREGLLRTIDPEADFPEYKIRRVRPKSGWLNCGEVKVRVECYENTFRCDRMARMHLFFAQTRNLKDRIDDIAVVITVADNEKTILSRHRIVFDAEKTLREGIGVCRFDPWESQGLIDAAKERVLYLNVSVETQQKNGNELKALSRIQFKEMKVHYANR